METPPWKSSLCGNLRGQALGPSPRAAGVACVIGLTQLTLSCRMLTPKQESLGCGGKRRSFLPGSLFLLSHWRWGHRAPKLPTNPNLVPQLPVHSGSHVYHHLHLYPGTYSQPLNSSLLWLAGVNLCGLQPGTLMKR